MPVLRLRVSILLSLIIAWTMDHLELLLTIHRTTEYLYRHAWILEVGQFVELEEVADVDGDAEVDEATQWPALRLLRLPSFGGATWRPRLPFRILGLLSIIGFFSGKHWLNFVISISCRRFVISISYRRFVISVSYRHFNWQAWWLFLKNLTFYAVKCGWSSSKIPSNK